MFFRNRLPMYFRNWLFIFDFSMRCRLLTMQSPVDCLPCNRQGRDGKYRLQVNNAHLVWGKFSVSKCKSSVWYRSILLLRKALNPYRRCLLNKERDVYVVL